MKLEGIDAEFARLAKLMKASNKLQTRKTVETMVEELIVKTPIDTGLARKSWKMIEQENGITVENSTEYIEYLNQGSSKQAPARFIESVALKYGVPIGTIVEVKQGN